MTFPISAVVIAKNESRNIGRCLRSLQWCDEVVVVDDHSEDDTVDIAESLGARVVNHRFESFAAQRNWALEAAGLHHPWALMLDADEAMTPESAGEVAAAVAAVSPKIAGFLMCRKTMFLNRWLRHCDGFPVWIMRLVHVDRARFVDSGHGEVPAPPVDGELARIRQPFLHYPFSHGVSHWFARHNVYSSREAELELQGRLPWSWRDILRGKGPEHRRAIRNLGRNAPLRPFWRFLYHYVWRKGFLDGRAGLAYSLLMATYEGMILLKRREKELECVPLDPPAVEPLPRAGALSRSFSAEL